MKRFLILCLMLQLSCFVVFADAYHNPAAVEDEIEYSKEKLDEFDSIFPPSITTDGQVFTISNEKDKRSIENEKVDKILR